MESSITAFIAKIYRCSYKVAKCGNRWKYHARPPVIDSNQIVFHGAQQNFRILSNAYSQLFSYEFLRANAVDEVYRQR